MHEADEPNAVIDFLDTEFLAGQHGRDWAWSRDLAYFDLEQKTRQPLDNPFGTRLSPMS
ncbi:MAG TPA: hypothetical protein VNJ49_14120 [Bradyrhizobium sp.]|nr:hypothetical protein [Bradyrhizobium sp.]